VLELAALKCHEIPCSTIAAAAAGNMVIDRQYRKLKSIIMFMDLTPAWPTAAAAS